MNVSWKQSSASWGPTDADQEPEHVGAVFVDQGLERRQGDGCHHQENVAQQGFVRSAPRALPRPGAA